MRIQTGLKIIVWVETSCRMTERVSHVRNYSTRSLARATRLYYKLSVRALAMACQMDRWNKRRAHSLVCEARLTFRVSWTEWFKIERYAREYLEQNVVAMLNENK